MEAVKTGQHYENHVAKLIRSKLDKSAVRNKGSGNQWQRKNDIFTQLPLAIECKYHQNIKVHEWFAQAEAAASITEVPVVIFANDNHPQDMALLRLTDLLNYMVEIADLRAEVEDLRAPINTTPPPKVVLTDEQRAEIKEKLNAPTAAKIERGGQTCRAGHLADHYGYCMQRDCKYSRGYKPPKKKAGK
jgi:hypothetical protein